MKERKTEYKRLYWSTDKEKINEILQHMNVKYLVGIYERYKRYTDEGIPHNLEDYENPENYRYQEEVKYDGCIFNASKKTIRKELIRRGLIKVKEYCGWDGEKRYFTTDLYKYHEWRNNSNVKAFKKVYDLDR